jgi:hypothetical protein
MKTNLITKALLIFGLIIFLGNSVYSQNQYIGAAKCKMCHNKPEKGAQYDKWASDPHSKAMESLKDADATNPKCLKCHSTAGSVDQGLIATLTVAEGVSCETCHGPGSVYKSMTMMKDKATSLKNGLIEPNEALCRKCHNEESPNFKGFDYATYSSRIAHPNPAK